MFIYLDDILIFSKSLQEHVGQVKCVLLNKLFVKAEKYEFHVFKVSFLGFVVAAGNIQVDPTKGKAVLDWLVPASWMQMMMFLGFNDFYQSFIRNYCSVASVYQTEGQPGPPEKILPRPVLLVWSPLDTERKVEDYLS